MCLSYFCRRIILTERAMHGSVCDGFEKSLSQQLPLPMQRRISIELPTRRANQTNELFYSMYGYFGYSIESVFWIAMPIQTVRTLPKFRNTCKIGPWIKFPPPTHIFHLFNLYIYKYHPHVFWCEPSFRFTFKQNQFFFCHPLWSHWKSENCIHSGDVIVMQQ